MTPKTAKEWAAWFQQERAGRIGHDGARSRQAERLGINERQIKAIELRQGSMTLRAGTQLLLEQAFRRAHEQAVKP